MKKIMFSDHYGLTEAVLSGRKTMTRRVAIPPTAACLDKIEHAELVSHKKYGQMVEFHTVDMDGRHSACRVVLPFKVGDVVAVAQRYETLANSCYCSELGMMDTPTTFKKEFCGIGWSNKMFVRADLMPHRIRITDLWFERLQNISDEDCLKEGVEKWMDCYIVSGIMERGGKNNVCFDTPREAFAALIDRICGRGTWKSNPWAVAYEFELIEKED